MKASQITAAGVPTNKWVTLEKAFRFVGLAGDANLVVVPTAHQFYFDTTNECLYVRKTYGKAYELEKDEEVKTGYVEVEINGKRCQIKTYKGGYQDANAGLIHTAISFTSVVGFLNI